ncbi:MAG: flavodoxin [Clostridia bacterium]|nr:flavodoxin [Clostridia bacterium]
MSKKLVAYFSASGVTKEAAQKVSNAANADIYEIEPKVPYTSADLNWLDKKSRSSVEMKDKSFRPEIADKKIDISGYDVIFIGFPIWWYVAPTIINTFLEAHDFSGKKIVLFATSGGSGFGKTVEELKPSCDESASFVDCKLLNRNSEEQILNWIDGLNL